MSLRPLAPPTRHHPDAQHRIIEETSASLAGFLVDELAAAGHGRLRVIEEAPTPDATQGRLPALSIYLYQVSLDPEGTGGNVASEVVRRAGADGSIDEYTRQRRLWVRLDYLVSVWGERPADEQALLGLLIRAFMEHPSIPRGRLAGESFEDDFKLAVMLSTRLDEGTLSRFWGGLGRPARPALQAWTSVPIIPQALAPLRRTQALATRIHHADDDRSSP